MDRISKSSQQCKAFASMSLAIFVKILAKHERDLSLRVYGTLGIFRKNIFKDHAGKRLQNCPTCREPHSTFTTSKTVWYRTADTTRSVPDRFVVPHTLEHMLTKQNKAQVKATLSKKNAAVREPHTRSLPSKSARTPTSIRILMCWGKIFVFVARFVGCFRVFRQRVSRSLQHTKYLHKTKSPQLNRLLNCHVTCRSDGAVCFAIHTRCCESHGNATWVGST